MQIVTTRACAALLLFAAAPTAVLAGERYQHQALEALTFTEGELPAAAAVRRLSLERAGPDHVYAQLDGPGEAYVRYPDESPNWGTWDELLLAVRVDDANTEVTGRLFVPAEDRMRVLRFRMSTESARDDSGEVFLEAQRDYYDRLLDIRAPGAAWFRYRRDEAARALSADGTDPETAGWRRRGGDDLEDAYALFSGGRALAENLQLDRTIDSDGGASANIPIESIEGITTQEFDWTELTDGLEPELDPLASFVPHDQHAVFFPSLTALVDVLDEATRNGTPVVDMLEPIVEDARTRERYETQLCLPLDVWARTLGPLAVGEIAITGSDPYLRSGTDVAVLLQARDAKALEAFLAARRQAAADAHPGTVLGEGGVRGLSWSTAVSPDRRVSSYALTIGDTIVVSNSQAQLERLIATVQSESPSLADSAEYAFFRDRYRRGTEGEKAFAMLTDATIRRWCSPRWRIGVARRTWQTALAAEDYAGSIAAASPEDVLADTWRVEAPLEFQTPVLELDVARVSAAERDSYNRFRNRYQSNWRAFFDPIAIRIGVEAGRTELDVSVWPLINGTDYDELFSIARGARFEPLAGDPHADALAHVIFGINKESSAFRSFSGFAGSFCSDFGANPFRWIGDSISFYADDAPFWQEWRDAAAEDDRDTFIEDELHRLPVLAHIEVSDPLSLTAFLTTLRSFSDQAAPNMVVWENRTHAGTTYVRVAPAAPTGTVADDFAIYYAPTPTALMLTLDEATLQRALERRAEPADSADTGETGEGSPLAWLGESAGLRVDARALEWLRRVWSDEWVGRARRASWRNVAALNEWRRHYPGQDAVRVHEQLWGTHLRCPGGGAYEWDETWQTYRSTVYGHPALPLGDDALAPALERLLTLSFGLTLENEGLRARAEVTREAAQ